MKYTITVEESKICIYEVEAENAKEAEYKFDTGEWKALADGPSSTNVIKIEEQKCK